MKRNLVGRVSGLLVAMAIVLSALPVRAGPQGRAFGLGVILGEPTGLTAKYWLNEANALDFHLTFDFSDEAFAFFVDYLFHFDVIPESSAVDLPLYVGIGGKLGVRDDDRRNDDDVLFGLRIPIGLDILLTRAPVEFFVEVAPGLRLIPGTDADIDAGIGVRYYF